jgi:hypothetical protein
MLMTPLKLLVFRLYNLTLGRTPWGARGLRYLLERLLIRGEKPRYVQSSRYFLPSELDERETEKTGPGTSIE